MSQAGDSDNGGDDEAGRRRQQQSRRGAGRGRKGGGCETERVPKGVGEATEKRER